MSTEQANGKTMEEKKDKKVAEVTEKLDNLAVDNTNEANENKPARRGGRGGFRGRGRGRGRGGRMGFTPRPPYDEQVKQIEEELKNKKVLEKGVKGYVKWFSVRGRYGFVAREKATDETEDFFVHQTAIAKSSTIKYYLRTLDDDEPVVFDIVEGRKGAEAANVTGPDGENVRGSRFARSLLTRWGPRGGARGNGGHRKPRENGGDEKEGAPEESGDGETRGKRRVRRARGKLQPDAENGEKPQEKGDGDASPADGEKKGRRRNRNNKGKKEAGETKEQNQEAAPTKA